MIEKDADNVDGGSEAFDANGPNIADGDTYKEEEEEEGEEAGEDAVGDGCGRGGGSEDAELMKMTDGVTYEEDDDCNVDSEAENENTADGDTYDSDDDEVQDETDDLEGRHTV